jgi:hypothetical protein
MKHNFKGIHFRCHLETIKRLINGGLPDPVRKICIGKQGWKVADQLQIASLQAFLNIALLPFDALAVSVRRVHSQPDSQISALR